MPPQQGLSWASWNPRLPSLKMTLWAPCGLLAKCRALEIQVEPKPTLSFRRGPILTGRQAASWSVWTRPVQSEHPSWQAGNQLYLCGAWLGLAARFWVGWLVFFLGGGLRWVFPAARGFDEWGAWAPRGGGFGCGPPALGHLGFRSWSTGV